ncbi:unnamed protein product [Protopolystoma xenopodis]|uniref:Uncharacterized protein n=1 Tax=Protopolystoma xenopodis TaxID=117903 RepID=A0A448WI30_9PLAT|nr:unnamed protein product [Protopolystoma xenopodis]
MCDCGGKYRFALSTPIPLEACKLHESRPAEEGILGVERPSADFIRSTTTLGTYVSSTRDQSSNLLILSAQTADSSEQVGKKATDEKEGSEFTGLGLRSAIGQLVSKHVELESLHADYQLVSANFVLIFAKCQVTYSEGLAACTPKCI